MVLYLQVLSLQIDCCMPVLVTCDLELVGVITPEAWRQTVEVPCEDGQSVLLHSDMPYFLYSAAGEGDDEDEESRWRYGKCD